MYPGSFLSFITAIWRLWRLLSYLGMWEDEEIILVKIVKLTLENACNYDPLKGELLFILGSLLLWSLSPTFFWGWHWSEKLYSMSLYRVNRFSFSADHWIALFQRYMFSACSLLNILWRPKDLLYLQQYVARNLTTNLLEDLNVQNQLEKLGNNVVYSVDHATQIVQITPDLLYAP